MSKVAKGFYYSKQIGSFGVDVVVTGGTINFKDTEL